MSTEKGQKMTLKMSTEGNKIPLNFIMRVNVMPATVEKETPLHGNAFCTTPDGDIFSLRICSTLCSLSTTFKVRYVCHLWKACLP